jgi:hypothetical protein
MTLLAITIGSLLGTLLGNLSILWVIGKIAQNQEKEKLREVQ